MVTNNEIDSALASVAYLIQCFYTTVQCNDQCKPIFSCIVDALVRNAISFRIAIGQVKLQARVKLPEKTINYGHCGRSMHIIVSIDKNPLLISDGLFDPGNGLIHVFHQEGVVKRRQVRTEKAPCILKVSHAPIY